MLLRIYVMQIGITGIMTVLWDKKVEEYGHNSTDMGVKTDWHYTIYCVHVCGI